MNILFTCAGRRNYLVNYFREALGDQGSVYAADMQATAPSLASADKAFTVPSVYDPEYPGIILDICIANTVDVIISLNDLELPVLVKNRELFENKGIRVLVSSKEVTGICFDKWKTYSFLNGIGLHTPKTFLDAESVYKSIEHGGLDFPLMIKPRWGSASIGIEYVESRRELELALELVKYKLRRSPIAKASEEDIENAIMIQEFLDGPEYGLDIVNDLSGKYTTTIVKRKITMRAGETDKAQVVYNRDLLKIGRIIGEKLGHIANLDCDVILHNKKYHVLEFNNRFGGGYPFSHMAGANIPLAIVLWLEGKDPPRELFQVREHMAFSKFDNLIQIPFNNG